MLQRIWCSAATAALLILCAPAAHALNGPDDPFELEGNVVDNTPGSPGTNYDDWETLKNGSGSALIKTGVPIADDASSTVFEGGDKDIMDIPDLGYVTQSVPDKDDILNGAAAAYLIADGTDPGEDLDLAVFFGADRLDNNGDAFLGIWFFQDNVATDGAGGFTGAKTLGDVLILANYINGGATAIVEVLEWDPVACPKKDPGNTDTFGPGKCPADNLQILFKQQASCLAGDNDTACAVANAGGEATVWPFQAKDGSTATYPTATFFEGGANLSTLFGGVQKCFASFMIETRSSASETAQLKDFIVGSFPLCRVEIAKVCSKSGYYDTATQTVIVPWSATATNQGFAPVDITMTDDLCGYGTPLVKTFYGVQPQSTVTWDDNDASWQPCAVPAANAASGIRNGVKATADDDGAPVTVIRANSCTVDSGDDDWCYDACGFNTDPSIDVTKDCKIVLYDAGDNVQLRVKYTGTVTNDSNLEGGTPTPLTNVQVTDVHGTQGGGTATVGPLLLKKKGEGTGATAVNLEPGEWASFEGTYTPNFFNAECPSDPSNSYGDTATATATSVIGGTPPMDTAPATCKVCTENCGP